MCPIHASLAVIQPGLLGVSMRMALLPLHAPIRVTVKENRLWKQTGLDLAQSRVRRIHVILAVTQQTDLGVSKLMVLVKELVTTHRIAKGNLRRVFKSEQLKFLLDLDQNTGLKTSSSMKQHQDHVKLIVSVGRIQQLRDFNVTKAVPSRMVHFLFQWF